MAALVFCVCGALYDLCEFTDAFRRCNGDYRATLKYLQYKNRLRLFQLYRSEFWLNYRQRQRMLAGIAAAKKSAAKQDSGAVTSNSDQVQDFDVMSRRAGGGGGIDFAAIEASAEAFEAIDAFAINSRASCEDFLQMERQNAGFRENYYNDDEIEIIDGFEDDSWRLNRSECSRIIVPCSDPGMTNQGQVPLGTEAIRSLESIVEGKCSE